MNGLIDQQNKRIIFLSIFNQQEVYNDDGHYHHHHDNEVYDAAVDDNDDNAFCVNMIPCVNINLLKYCVACN